MKVYLDAMGGDNAPKEIIKGAIEAKAEKGYEIILVGKEDVIKEELARWDQAYQAAASPFLDELEEYRKGRCRW